MNNTIFIKELKLFAHVGIHEWEQQNRQPVIIDVELTLASSNAERSDDIHDTCDYAQLAEKIRLLILEKSFNLVERLASNIADICLSNPQVTAVTVNVAKPNAIAYATSAGVRLSRKASENC